VHAGDRVGPESCFIGKDQRAGVQSREPLAPGTGFHKGGGGHPYAIIFGGGRVADCPEPFIKSPVGIGGQSQAVGGVVILAEPEGLDVGGLNHDGPRGGREGPTGESAGEGVTGKDLVPKAGRAAGLAGGLGLWRLIQ